jgi:hypothetical protein
MKRRKAVCALISFYSCSCHTLADIIADGELTDGARELNSLPKISTNHLKIFLREAPTYILAARLA